MSCSSAEERSIVVNDDQKKYKGIRRRKWGKWVSEIRVPGTQDRLWLGSYTTPEAAAVAHDIAFYCLRKPSSLDTLNFPLLLPATTISSTTAATMSPKSIQREASDAGMAVDAQMISATNDIAKANETDDDHVLHRDLKTEFWENVDVQSDSCGQYSWDGSEQGKEGGEGLSISIEDYLYVI